MSIILKGIDLPKDIDELRLIINGMSIAIEPAKAIQIPKGHGRLIDGDKLKKRLYGYERWTGIDEAPYEYAEKEVYDAPTILEAEE